MAEMAQLEDTIATLQRLGQGHISALDGFNQSHPVYQQVDKLICAWYNIPFLMMSDKHIFDM